ncbi:MAG: peptidase T [Gammaproteobacteria bacterium]|nr:peptidase T [Gammaproteobacteria bacterium]
MKNINIQPKIIESSLLEKFLRYVKIDTQSKENAIKVPSTPTQLDFAKLLKRELKALGIKKIQLENTGFLYASIPSNISPLNKAYKKIPAIGFIAHLDTSPESSGKNIKPQVIRNYNGKNLALPKNNAIVIRGKDYPALKNNIGKTIVTSDGTTLLGADNKAGIAIIMVLAEILSTHPEISHGEIKIAFTPDEEIGAKGGKLFNLKKFGAKVAYTVDGENAPELNKESFNANLCIITVHGKNTHPGKAKNILLNSIRIISEILALLPKNIAPEHTSGYEPYMHPYKLEGDVDKSTARILLRAFSNSEIDRLKALITKITKQIQAKHPKAKIELEITESYRNMREKLEKNPRVTNFLFQAAKMSGLKPVWAPIRGGTDGTQLTARGLPTPNIFSGSSGHHGKTEWVSIFEMRKSLETIINLIQIWSSNI